MRDELIYAALLAAIQKDEPALLVTAGNEMGLFLTGRPRLRRSSKPAWMARNHFLRCSEKSLARQRYRVNMSGSQIVESLY